MHHWVGHGKTSFDGGQGGAVEVVLLRWCLASASKSNDEPLKQDGVLTFLSICDDGTAQLVP